MTLLLSRQDLDGILDLNAAIEVTRAMVLEEVGGNVVHMPGFGGSGGPRWIMRVVGGALFGVGRLGIRAGSLSLLFDTETDAPLAIMDLPTADVRLAASVGLAGRYLARPDARRVGLIGSGKIALGILQGLCSVRKIESVAVYSRNPEHCRAFAARAQQALDIPVTSHHAPEPVIADADVVATATNSHAPVVRYENLRPGTHVTSSGLNMELDASVYLRADQFVVASQQQEIANALPTNAPGRVTGGTLHDLLKSGALKREAFVPLGAIARGDVAPCNGPHDINIYRDSRGGLGDAALASWAFDRARERGLGLDFVFR